MMTAQLRQIYRFILNKQHRQLQHARSLHRTGVRCLLSSEILGLENFKRQQASTKDKIGDLQDIFRLRMTQYMESDKNTIFTGDLKNMIYAATSAQDLVTTKLMIERFRDQRGGLGFSTFVFGPLIMRMCHILSQPDLAFTLFTDKRIGDGFFDQMSTFTVLMDQLFEHGRYGDVLTVMAVVTKRKVNGLAYPADCLILASASCCKLNTPEAYTYAVDMIKGCHGVGNDTPLRAIIFAARLALKQNDPKTAMEFIDTTKEFKGVRPASYTNMKVLTLTALGQVEDAILELRCLLKADGPETRMHDAFPDVVDKLTKAVEEKRDPELTQRMQEVQRGLQENSHMHTMLYDDYIFGTIERKRREQMSFKARKRSNPTGYGLSHQSRHQPSLRQWEDQARG